MDLNQIREKVERYSEEISKAYYLQGAGLKTNIDFDDIYTRYSGLFSEDNLLTIKDSISKSSNSDDKRRANSLLEAFYGEIITQKHKSLISELLELETTSIIEIESGKSVPYRSSMSYLLDEPSAWKRQQIQQNIESFVGGKLNHLLEESFLQEEKSINSLGFANKIEMFTSLSGIDLYKTDLIMQDFINETDELYTEYLGIFSKKILNMSAEDLERHDLLRIMRASEFDCLFPKEKMFRIISGFITSMGIDIYSNKKIKLDIEPRENKSPRAFCSAVRIPDEVYLVVYPRGGENDYSVFLHELGHALHFSNVNPELDFEYKWYGDNSVTEAYAMTFDHLTMNERWMNKYLNVNPANNGDYFVHRALNELISLRTLAAKLHYEIRLYETPSLYGKKELYRKIFEKTLKVSSSPVNYLVNIDNYFYCVRYIRAWMLQANIMEYLNRNYGELWFDNRNSGSELLSWWSEGQRYNAEELCNLKGWSDLSLSVIVKNINEILKNNKFK